MSKNTQADVKGPITDTQPFVRAVIGGRLAIGQLLPTEYIDVAVYDNRGIGAGPVWPVGAQVRFSARIMMESGKEWSSEYFSDPASKGKLPVTFLSDQIAKNVEFRFYVKHQETELASEMLRALIVY